MISTPLLKQTIRSNWKMLLIFTAVPCIFLAMTTAVFTAETMNAMSGLLASGALPEAMTNLMGDRLNNLTLSGMLATNFFEMMGVIFPMIYLIITGNKLIASQVDRGSMAYILSTPTTRNQVTQTQALYLVGSLVAMFGVIAGVGCIAANAFQPGALDIKVFLLMDLGSFLLAFAISGVCYSASCVFNLSKNSLAIGAGLPLTFFVCNLMAKMGDGLANFKYFSLMTLFDTDKILTGSGYAPKLIALAVIGVTLYALGMVVFSRKDLPL